MSPNIVRGPRAMRHMLADDPDIQKRPVRLSELVEMLGPPNGVLWPNHGRDGTGVATFVSPAGWAYRAVYRRDTGHVELLALEGVDPVD